MDNYSTAAEDVFSTPQLVEAALVQTCILARNFMYLSTISCHSSNIFLTNVVSAIFSCVNFMWFDRRRVLHTTEITCICILLPQLL